MLACARTQQSPGTSAEPAGLTPREKELLALVAQGRTDAQIAAELFISIRTVRSHLDRIRDKTGSRRRADLTMLALQAGVV
jgi:DNA-binding CsgD family transcriptional regulator